MNLTMGFHLSKLSTWPRPQWKASPQSKRDAANNGCREGARWKKGASGVISITTVKAKGAALFRVADTARTKRNRALNERAVSKSVSCEGLRQFLTRSAKTDPPGRGVGGPSGLRPRLTAISIARKRKEEGGKNGGWSIDRKPRPTELQRSGVSFPSKEKGFSRRYLESRRGSLGPNFWWGENRGEK